MFLEPILGLLQRSNSCAFSLSCFGHLLLIFKLCICACGWKFKHRPEEGSRFSGAGVRGGCGMLEVNIKN